MDNEKYNWKNSNPEDTLKARWYDLPVISKWELIQQDLKRFSQMEWEKMVGNHFATEQPSARPALAAPGNNTI